MVFTKASAAQPFLRRDVASAPLPWLFSLLSVLSCPVRSGHRSIYCRAVPAHLWKLIHTTPAPNTCKDYEFLLSFLSYLLESACASKHLSISGSWTWGAVLQQHFCWQRVLDSSVVPSSSCVNSSSGPCVPMSWTIQEPTYLEKVLF